VATRTKIALMLLSCLLVGWPASPKDMTIFWSDAWHRDEQADPDHRVPVGFVGCWQLPKRQRGNWRGAVLVARTISGLGISDGTYVPFNDSSDYRYVALRERHQHTVIDGQWIKAIKHGVSVFCNISDARSRPCSPTR